MLGYSYKSVNNIRISGCIVKDATFRGNSFANFRIAHNVSAKGGTLFYDCEMYVYGKKKLPVELLKKGSKVILEGKFDSRRRTNYINVENVVANELRMTVLSNGEKKAALSRVNQVELNGEICAQSYFGRNNVVVRFRILHRLDQVNSIIKDCVMFASDADGKLPVELIQSGGAVVIRGREGLNTYRNPDGDEEIIVDEISAAEEIQEDETPAEKVTVPVEAEQDETAARTLPAAVPVAAQVIEEPELFSLDSVARPAPEGNNASPRFICETVHF